MATPEQAAFQRALAYTKAQEKTESTSIWYIVVAAAGIGLGYFLGKQK